MSEARSSRWVPAVWPESEAAALVSALARESGLTPDSSSASGPDVQAACHALGLETARVELTGEALRAALRKAAPAVVKRPQGGLLGLLMSGRNPVLLTPAMSRMTLSERELASELLSEPRAGQAPAITALLERYGIRGRRRDKAFECLMDERLRGVPAGVLWELRAAPTTSFWGQVRGAGLTTRLGLFLAAHALEMLLLYASWGLAGQGALSGRIDPGWLTAWVLLLLTLVPLRMFTTWSQGVLAAGFGGLFKQRVMAGALQLAPDSVRLDGAGGFLGRILEAEALETAAIGGGLACLLALVELGAASAILFQSGWLPFTAVVAWAVLLLILALGYARARRLWTECRLQITGKLVEVMTGHRTRLAQEPPTLRHQEEDAATEAYLAHSEDLDRKSARLEALAARGWMVVGIASLAPAFLESAGPVPLAIGIGGVLAAQLAFKRAAFGLSHLAGAWVAWRQAEPLFRTAFVKTAAPSQSTSSRLLEAHGVEFRHAGRNEAVLRDCTLEIRAGDRLLLEGESGGGKSTLASVLAGLRAPGSGLLLAGGLDGETLGAAGWRKRVACAPQYHENHVLSAPLAFNLLMGRAWPPQPDDIREAENVCRELGLGPLLERMPGGLWQMVGDTGWQLSQGERSRLYMARALLQGAPLVVLDESLAALDPETAGQAVECLIRRAQALLVVAHP